ncbi:MAG: 3'(2'),5'-bisphosphate nucleotidase [Spirochaetaceae bacterium]|nr:MAG: 3'(2'),5'-bisphosphate nucleotidase [Spirochaetaceae bacterium]
MIDEHDEKELSRLLVTAIEAARHAAAEVMDVYQRDFDVTEKSDRSPLTEADTRSHREILRILQANTPDLPILSEEGAQLSWQDRRRWYRYWLVDPLDGTKEFIKHNDEFTVNIALMETLPGEQGEDAAVIPRLGVVLAPALHRLYAGIVGGMAYRASESGTARVSLPDEALTAGRPYTIVASRSHMSPETEAFIGERRGIFPDLKLVSSGSSLKICRVAEGSADEYPRFAPTMEWDTAAGDAVARASGCEVLRWNPGAGGGPAGSLLYNKEDLHNPWFLVRRKTEQEGTD